MKFLLFCSVKFYEFVQVSVSCLCIFFRFLKETICFLRILSYKSIVTNLSVQECFVISCFGALLSRVNAFFAFCCQSRIVTEVIPVTYCYCKLLLCLSFAHTLLDTMVDTRSISNDQRRSRICLSLCDCLYTSGS